MKATITVSVSKVAGGTDHFAVECSPSLMDLPEPLRAFVSAMLDAQGVRAWTKTMETGGPRLRLSGATE